MARFRLQEGEQVIERKRVRNAAGDLRDECELILTDRRIALMRVRRPAIAMFFGFLGGLLGEAFRDTRLETQIARDQFGSAEATRKNELNVRSTGEGYLHARIDVQIKNAAEWVDRLQRWAAGEASEVASATVVKT